MGLFKPKQIDKVISAPIKITNMAVGAGVNQVIVTSQISSALNTAGNNGVSVPFLVSGSVYQNGVVVTAPINRVEIYDTLSKEKFQSATTDEVYGRLVFSGSDYTIQFYYLASTGIETAFTTGGAINIDFDFVYRFTFDTLPTDALVSMQVKNVNQDPKGQNATLTIEKLTVTATNVLTQLQNIPTFSTKTILSVNGKEEYCFGAAPSFVVTGTNITWNAGNAGYALETTDVVYVKYYL